MRSLFYTGALTKRNWGLPPHWPSWTESFDNCYSTVPFTPATAEFRGTGAKKKKTSRKVKKKKTDSPVIRWQCQARLLVVYLSFSPFQVRERPVGETRSGGDGSESGADRQRHPQSVCQRSEGETSLCLLLSPAPATSPQSVCWCTHTELLFST